jgi:hypothetical protein
LPNVLSVCSVMPPVRATRPLPRGEIVGHFVAGKTVFIQTASFATGIKEIHAVACYCQVMSDSKPGGPAPTTAMRLRFQAHGRTGFPGLAKKWSVAWRWSRPILGGRPSAFAWGLFTQGFGRADAATDPPNTLARKMICRAAIVALGDALDKAQHINIRRAGAERGHQSSSNNSVLLQSPHGRQR